jgi:hypothetical protein
MPDLELITEIETLRRIISSANPDLSLIDRGIQSISQREPHQALQALFAVGSDDFVYGELIWELIHAVESYDGVVYTSALVTALQRLITEAPNFMTTLLVRAINSASHRSQLREIFKTNSLIRKDLERALEMVIDRFPDKKPLTDDLLGR